MTVNRLLTALGRIESDLNEAIMLANKQREFGVRDALMDVQDSPEWLMCATYDGSEPPSGMSEDEAEQRVRY